MLHRIWRDLKRWRRISLGPVSLVFKLEKAIRLTPGLRRRRQSLRHTEAVRELAPPPEALPEAAPRELAVVVGCGPGVGHALARHLAGNGFDLLLVSRNAEQLSGLVDELHEGGCGAAAFGADATDEASVGRLFAHIGASHGRPALVVYSLQYSGPGRAMDIELPAFELSWRHNCLGAFLVARAAARLMQPAGQGTIVLVGSTSALVGRAGHLNLAVGKFGQRALAQVMARELWPMGVHVAHAVIDADVAEDVAAPGPVPQADPRDVASAILALHRQPRSAWTSELDLRPWNETFWEHC